MSRVIIAGHLCLDIIPEILTSTPIEPGQLVDTGPSILSTGGAVSNVGLALKKLGVGVALVAKIGEDAFGDAIGRFVRGYGDGTLYAAADGHMTGANFNPNSTEHLKALRVALGEIIAVREAA